MKENRSIFARMAAMLSLLIAGPGHADQADCDRGSDGSALRQAEQKVVLLERLVGVSAPVQRVFNSGRTDAIASIEAARASAKQARQDLQAGCNASAAEAAATGLNQASQAFKLVRNQDTRGEQEYQELHRRTASFLRVLESHPGEMRAVGADDLVGMKRQISRAETLAIDGIYGKANALLKPVADRLERRLIAIFDQQTVYYEREFTSLENEYEYLAEQYHGYLLLLQLVGNERKPPFSSREKYDMALQLASQLNGEAEQLAASGDWQTSLSKMREALTKCEQALRWIGVRY